MTLIIDGHNLIPKVPGMTLRMLDDEPRLAHLLQVYARVRRKEVIVFFDGAPPAQAGKRNYGTVQAVFVSKSSTADSAIKQHLAALGKGARAVTVVTSDRMVRAEARSAGAMVIASEDFAKELLLAQREEAYESKPEKAGRTPARRVQTPAQPAKPDKGPAPTSSEVDEWLQIFNEAAEKKKRK